MISRREYYRPVDRHLTGSSDPDDWWTEALCAEVDTELFFPELGQNTGPARQVCRSCPVIEDCLEYALSHPDRLEGVWGGTTPRQRRDIRRRRRESAA